MYTKLFIGWIIYFAIHSVLASNEVKKICENKFPFLFRYYRMLFNVIAIGGLIIMITITLSDKELLFKKFILLDLLSALFFISGIIVFIIAAYTFNLKEFLGFEKQEIDTQNKLVTKGIYNYVRHPLYTGTILVSLGYFLYSPTLSVVVFLCLSFIYIEIGSRLEEKKLMNEFGSEYAEYCKAVKRYFPFIY